MPCTNHRMMGMGSATILNAPFGKHVAIHSSIANVLMNRTYSRERNSVWTALLRMIMVTLNVSIIRASVFRAPCFYGLYVRLAWLNTSRLSLLCPI
ncbi:hypothetical protein BDV39DRAFT_169063 [Aspergillus sergii]|uniref:Uncharacterized protein n=1 Tax=Aspergillus sergii TaxID=1034303 RepID=A0A5N6XD31_9EURO|nr:hypothetical protein BDV39DRAFT_169063 [Aspergillus sergii]